MVLIIFLSAVLFFHGVCRSSLSLIQTTHNHVSCLVAAVSVARRCPGGCHPGVGSAQQFPRDSRQGPAGVPHAGGSSLVSAPGHRRTEDARPAAETGRTEGRLIV